MTSRLRALIAALSLLIFAGCSTFHTTVDATYTSNRATYGVVHKYYAQKCVETAKECVLNHDRECEKAHQCLKQFEIASKLSAGIDSALYAALKLEKIGNEEGAMQKLNEALRLALDLKNIADKLIPKGGK